MRIDIAPHNAPTKTTLTSSPTSPTFTFHLTHTTSIITTHTSTLALTT
jgi:hypothetical protein